MDNLTKALSLVELGCHVFPVVLTKDGSKVPAISTQNGGHGHLDATDDPEQVAQWFQNEFPKALPGVHAGRSGLVLLDVDVKESVNGFDSLDAMFYTPLPETFNYTSANGKGGHFIYEAPENVQLNGQSRYQGNEGVDRRAGSSWFLWAGDVPESRDAFNPAPAWLCDPAEQRTGAAYLGGLDEWLDELEPGKPQEKIVAAIWNVQGMTDLSHSEMVALQYNAVKYGAEGFSGVIEYLDAIREVWMNRPEGNHGTPRGDWDYKFDEALESAVKKYGAQIDELANLPEYSLNELPGFNTAMLVGEPQDKHHFTRTLALLIEGGYDKDRIATTLLGAPTTSHLAREWGAEFVYERIEKATKTPEPTRENPALEEKEATKEHTGFLTQEENEYLDVRPTFVDRYYDIARRGGYANPGMTRNAAWTIAGMVFAFRGFLPLDDGSSTKMGPNLWIADLSPSGTGKTSTMNLEQSVMDILFKGDSEEDEFYRMGGAPSPQGIHKTLVMRDRKPTIVHIDEASGFMKNLSKPGYMDTLDNDMSKWYSGQVEPNSNLTAKEIRGKSALTSFNMHLYATPDYFMEQVTAEKFKTGFVARILWTVSPPRPKNIKVKRFKLADKPAGFDTPSPAAMEVAIDLASAARIFGGTPTPLTMTREAERRLDSVAEEMHTIIDGHYREQLLVPAVTRMEDALMKCAMICAMYRGSTEIDLADALHAIRAVEDWFENLFLVVEKVSEGDFQRHCNDMEIWIRSKNGGIATETAILNRFKDVIARDPRELDAMLSFLVRSGRINRIEEAGKVTKYRVNGG